MGELLSIDQALAYLREHGCFISQHTLYRRLRSGALGKKYQTGMSRVWRMTRDELDTLRKEKAQTAEELELLESLDNVSDESYVPPETVLDVLRDIRALLRGK